MKTFLFIFLCSFLSLNTVLAQGPGHGGPPPLGEKAKALRVGVYTRVLELDTKEAKAFWLVCNEFDAWMDKLREEQETLRRESRTNFEDFSDKELETEIDKMVELRKRELDLWIAYYNNAKEVLPIQKVALLERAEREFKRELFQQLKERGRRY